MPMDDIDSKSNKMEVKSSHNYSTNHIKPKSHHQLFMALGEHTHTHTHTNTHTHAYTRRLKKTRCALATGRHGAWFKKFHNGIKREGQMYVKFTRDKEKLCKIDHNLLLIKEFRKYLPSEVKPYLNEKKVETLSQPGMLAKD